MSLFATMLTGVSGVTGETQRLSTISDNISNISTTGYKQTQTDFQSIFLQMDSPNAFSPGGVRYVTTHDIAAQGSIQTTGNATDLAVSGQGFFPVVLDPASTDIVYTRAGSFTMDSQGFLKNTAGEYLLALPPGSAAGSGPTSLVPVNLSQSTARVIPTTNAQLVVNLPGDDTAIATQTAVSAISQVPEVSSSFSIAGASPSQGDVYSVSIAGSSAPTNYTVTAGAGDTMNTIGAALASQISTNYPGADYDPATGSIFVPGVSASSVTSTVNGTGLTTTSGTALSFADRSVVPGDRYAVTVTGGNTYEVFAGQADTVDSMGATLAGKLAVDYPGASYDTATNTLFVPGAAAGDVTPSINQGYTTAVTIYDNLGNANAMNLVWTKAAATGTWNVTAGLPTLNGKTSATSVTGMPAQVKIGTNGLIDPTSLSSLASTITWDPAVTAAGSSTVNFDFSGLTGYGSTYQVSKINQNGSGLGGMSGVEVDPKGMLNILYTNGSKVPAYQLALGTFTNPDGLAPQMGNTYRQSVASGDVVISAPQTGDAGTIVAQSLEGSTVDVATELTSMIVTQNAYNANVKTITTSDQMLQTIIQIKQ
jgi:flagellar hook protein FlgE